VSAEQGVSATRSAAKRAQGVPAAWELAHNCVKRFPLAERSIIAVWPWLLSTAFRPEEVLRPRICQLPSFPLEAPGAARTAGRLPSEHRSACCCSPTAGSILNVSSQGTCSDQMGFVTHVLCRLPLGRVLLGCPKHLTGTDLFPAECTLMC